MAARNYEHDESSVNPLDQKQSLENLFNPETNIYNIKDVEAYSKIMHDSSMKNKLMQTRGS